MDKYKFSSNPVYTAESIQQQALASTFNPALLKKHIFGTFKPESNTSFEIGYKGLFNKKLFVDVYYYIGTYNNLIGRINVIQSGTGKPDSVGLLLNPLIYSVSANADQVVNTSGWGASVDYLLPLNFNIGGNISSDVIGDLPRGFVSFFNTPKLRYNLSFGNRGLFFKGRLGFNVNARWQDELYYQGGFAEGQLPAFTTVDAVLTFRLPSIHSLIKLGGTNIVNTYYRNALGSPSIGGLYYVSFAYNVF